MGSAHHLTEANIWPKFKENPSRGKGDMESNSWPSTVTLTLSPQAWVMGSAHCPTEVNIWPKFRENPPRGKGDTERTQNSRLKPRDLELWPCESAWLSYGFCTSFHWGKHLTKIKRKSVCDLVLESPWLSYGFCTSSHRWTFDQSLEKILPRCKGDIEWTWNSRLKPMTLNCDLDLESAWLSYWFCTSSH